MAVSAAIIAAPAAAAIARERREKEEKEDQQLQNQTSKKEEIHTETRTAQHKCTPEELHDMKMLDAFIGTTFTIMLVVVLFVNNFVSEKTVKVQ